MARIKASEARIPPEVFGRVAYKHERVRIERRSEGAVYLISEAEMALFEALEDYMDNLAADEALAEMKQTGRKPIAWNKLKAELGL